MQTATARLEKLVEEIGHTGVTLYIFKVRYNRWYKRNCASDALQQSYRRRYRRPRAGYRHQLEVDFWLYAKEGHILGIFESHSPHDANHRELIRSCTYACVGGEWFRRERLHTTRKSSLMAPSQMSSIQELLGLPRHSMVLSCPRVQMHAPPGPVLKTWAYTPEEPFKGLTKRIRREAPPPLHTLLIEYAKKQRYEARKLPQQRGCVPPEVYEELMQRLHAFAPGLKLDIRFAKVGHRPSVRAYNLMKKQGARNPVDFEVELPSGKYKLGFSYA